MIRFLLNLVIIILIQNNVLYVESRTSDVEERIEVLKQEIAAQIEQDQLKASETTPKIPSDQFPYVKESRIKPIIQHRGRKHRLKEKKDKHMRSAQMSTPSTREPSKKKHTKEIEVYNANNSPENPSKAKRPSKKEIVASLLNHHTPADQYYRRLFFDEEGRKKPQKWTHCLDLVTPFLNGVKQNITSKIVDTHDGTVVRLIQLLSIDTTGHSKEDIVSILYQLSNLRIRFFQWDINAMTTLMNVITKSRTHSFKTIKMGLKALFNRWHLDYTSIDTFLEQSRVFRPPCIAISEFEGSTQKPKASRYTTPQRKGEGEGEADGDNENADSSCDE